MDFALSGASPVGASVTSGTVSAFAALASGDLTVNGVAFPAFTSGVTAAGRVDQLQAVFDQLAKQTGVRMRRITTVTFSLESGTNLVIAFAGAASTANTGLTVATTSKTAVLLATRKAFGTATSGTDADIIKYGSQEINVKHAKQMGLLSAVGAVDIEIKASVAATRVNA